MKDMETTTVPIRKRTNNKRTRSPNLVHKQELLRAKTRSRTTRDAEKKRKEKETDYFDEVGIKIKDIGLFAKDEAKELAIQKRKKEKSPAGSTTVQGSISQENKKIK